MLYRIGFSERNFMQAKRFLIPAFSFWAALPVACPMVVQAQSTSSPAPQSTVAPLRTVIDDYHGIKVADPYRYMENLQDPAVQSWFKAQDDRTRSVLANIPGRPQLLARIEELDQSVSRVWAARIAADLYLVGKQLPSENVSKLYRRRGLAGEDALLLDPEKITLAGAGQGKGKNTIWGMSASHDAKYQIGRAAGRG